MKRTCLSRFCLAHFSSFRDSDGDGDEEVVLIRVVDECIEDVSLGDVEDDEDDLLRRKRRRSLLPVVVEEEEAESSDEMELAVVVEAPDLCRFRMDVGLLDFISSVLEDEEEELREEVRQMSFDLEFVLEAVEKVRLPAW